MSFRVDTSIRLETGSYDIPTDIVEQYESRLKSSPPQNDNPFPLEANAIGMLLIST